MKRALTRKGFAWSSKPKIIYRLSALSSKDIFIVTSFRALVSRFQLDRVANCPSDAMAECKCHRRGWNLERKPMDGRQPWANQAAHGASYVSKPVDPLSSTLRTLPGSKKHLNKCLTRKPHRRRITVKNNRCILHKDRRQGWKLCGEDRCKAQPLFVRTVTRPNFPGRGTQRLKALKPHPFEYFILLVGGAASLAGTR